MSEISLKSPSHSSCSPALYLDGASLEALDNALMPIMIGSDNNEIVLIIEDNGQGFDISSINLEKDPMSGYGLIAMRERCELFGGSFHLDSKPARGTRVNAILPLSLTAAPEPTSDAIR